MLPNPPPELLKNPLHLLSLGLGSGCIPLAPGSFGTLVAIPLFLLLQPLAPISYAVLIVLLFGLGVFLCGYTARALGVHDHPAIVWDEVVGYLITMFMAPAGWPAIVLGFVLFRFFDIVKPWPIRQIDRQVHGGLGIMLDDVLAGILAWFCLQAILVWAGQSLRIDLTGI